MNGFVRVVTFKVNGEFAAAKPEAMESFYEGEVKNAAPNGFGRYIEAFKGDYMFIGYFDYDENFKNFVPD